MTQHIRIFTKDHVDPYIAHVWRDDQLVMWSLAGEHLRWPDVSLEPHPIQFMTPTSPEFSVWIGSSPAPIGDPPPQGQPDRRNYVALANSIMPTGETQRYQYKIQVWDDNEQQMFVVRHRLGTDENGDDLWYDPDIGNEPQP